MFTKLLTAFSCAVATPAFAAERPSTEEVAKAVAEAREVSQVWEKATTKADAIRAIQAKIDMAKVVQSHARKEKDPKVREEMLAAATAEVVQLNKELADTRKNFQAPQRQKRLPKLDWLHLKVGSVGRFTRLRDDGGEYRGPGGLTISQGGSDIIFCYRKTSAGTFVAKIRVNKSPPSVVPADYDDTFVLVKGIPTDGMQPEKLLPDNFEFNAVVTGTYKLEKTGGYADMIPVLERFDPDVPFK